VANNNSRDFATHQIRTISLTYGQNTISLTTYTEHHLTQATLVIY